VDRIKAAREAIARSGHDVVLVGRSYLIGPTELAATIDRLVAYADAGADCLYAPGRRSTPPRRAEASFTSETALLVGNAG
jgi:2-methylisocitrate lyase-like PEP mutase family enzyme